MACVAFLIQLHTILGEVHFNNPQNSLPPTPLVWKFWTFYTLKLWAVQKSFLSNYIFLNCYFVVLAKGSAYEPFPCLGNIGNSCEVLSWGKYDSTQECINWVSIFFSTTSSQNRQNRPFKRPTLLELISRKSQEQSAQHQSEPGIDSESWAKDDLVENCDGASFYKNCDGSSFYKKVPLSPTNAAAYRTEWTRHEEQVRKQQEPLLTVISICRLENKDLISGGDFLNLQFGELIFFKMKQQFCTNLLR